jgi:hypothetical protein
MVTKIGTPTFRMKDNWIDFQKVTYYVVNHQICRINKMNEKLVPKIGTN